MEVPRRRPHLRYEEIPPQSDRRNQITRTQEQDGSDFRAAGSFTETATHDAQSRDAFYSDAQRAAERRGVTFGRGSKSLPPVSVSYEAFFTPEAFTPEPWWAFLVSYHNFYITSLTFLFWGFTIAFHQSATAFTLHRGTVVHADMMTAQPLHDLGHEWFPNTQKLRVIPEIGHVWPVLYLSGLMLYNFDQRSLDSFRTFLWCHGVLMLMRAACFSTTMLPDSSQQCHTSLFVGSCHDLVFSGHVMIMTLSVLGTYHFFPEALPPLIKVVLGVNHVVTTVMIVSSRNHYTVDVLLSLFITPFVFLSWTRHPTLVSLACASPDRVLAIESKLAGSPKATMNMCCGTQRRKAARAGRDGYPIVGSDALARLTKHAHSALRLCGLRPRMMVFRHGDKQPIYADTEERRTQDEGSGQDSEEDSGEEQDWRPEGRQTGQGGGVHWRGARDRHGREGGWREARGRSIPRDREEWEEAEDGDWARPVPGFVRLVRAIARPMAPRRSMSDTALSDAIGRTQGQVESGSVASARSPSASWGRRVHGGVPAGRMGVDEDAGDIDADPQAGPQAEAPKPEAGPR